MRRWRAGLLVLVLGLCVVGTLRLAPTTVTSSLAGGDIAETTRSQERAFGGEPIVVSVAGPLGSTLSPNGISELIALEGRLAELDGVATVVGPGGFINQTTIQTDRLVSTRLGPAARRAARAGDRARRRARQRGVSAAEAARVGDRARIAALGSSRPQFERALSRLGGVGLPSIANPAYVNAVVFGRGDAPKARFRWLFPDAEHAVIVVRPDSDIAPARVAELGREVAVLAGRARVRGATATVGRSPAAAVAVSSELGRVVPATLLLLGIVIVLASRGGPARRVATVAGIAAAATLAGVLAALAVEGGLSLAAVAAAPVLLAVTAALAYRIDALRGGSLSSAESARGHGDGSSRPVTTATAGAAGVALVGVAVATQAVGVPVLGDLVATVTIGAVVGSVVVLLVGPSLLRRLPPRNLAARGGPAGTRPSAVGTPVSRAERLGGSLRRRSPPGRIVLLAVAGTLMAAGLVLWATSPVRSHPARLGASSATERDAARDVARQVGVGGELRIALRGDVTTPAGVRWLDGLGRRARRIDRRIVVGPNVGELLAGEGRPTASRIAAVLAVTPEYLLKPMISRDRRSAELRFGIPPVGAEAERSLVRRLTAAAEDPPSGLSAQPVGLLAAADHSDRRLEAARYWLPAACVLLIVAGLMAIRRSLPRALVPVLPALAGTGAVGLVLASLDIALSPVVAAVVPVGLAMGVLLGLVAEEQIEATRASAAGLRRVLLPAVGLPAAMVAVAGVSLLSSRVGTVREFGALLTVDAVVAALAAVLLLPAVVERSGSGGTETDVEPNGNGSGASVLAPRVTGAADTVGSAAVR